MIYDYSILSALILSSLLILIIGIFRSILLKITAAQTNDSDENYLIHVNKVNIILKILFFLLLVIGLSKLTFIISYPIEINQLSINVSFYSLHFFYITAQGFIFFLYFLFFFLLLLFHRLKLDFRYSYLLKVLNFFLYFILADLLSSFIIYIQINFDLLLPGNFIKDMKPVEIEQGFNKSYLILLLSGLFYIIFYLRFQKRRSRFNSRIYGVFYFTTIILIIYLTKMNLPYFFETNSSLYSGISIYGYQSGFAGLVWLFVLLSGICSQIYSTVVLSQKSHFISVHHNINYFLQLNRVAFISTVGLIIITSLPLILKIIIN